MIGHSKSIGYDKDVMVENLNSAICRHALEEEEEEDEDEVVIHSLLISR